MKTESKTTDSTSDVSNTEEISPREITLNDKNKLPKEKNDEPPKEETLSVPDSLKVENIENIQNEKKENNEKKDIQEQDQKKVEEPKRKFKRLVSVGQTHNF